MPALMTAILETERLRLREFTPRDLDELGAMVGDPEQMTFYPRPKTRDEAAAWIERNLSLYRERGYGFWAMELTAEAGSFAGYCGIRPLAFDDGTVEIEIGWHVKKTFWNQGIATEAAERARGRVGKIRSLPRRRDHRARPHRVLPCSREDRDAR